MTDALAQLSEREREILKLVATGATNQQIANNLGISINTVKVHLRNTFGKIGVASRTEATMFAVRTGLVAVSQAYTGGEEPASAPNGSDVDVVSVPVVEPDMVSAPPLDGVETSSAVVVSHPDVEVLERPVIQPTVVSPAEVRRGPSQRTKNLVLGSTIVGLLLLVGWLGFIIEQKNSATVLAVPTTGSRLDPGQVNISHLTPIWTTHKVDAINRSGAGAASVDGKLFIVGGVTGGQPSTALVRYDPTTDVMSPLTAKPTAVGDVQAVVVNDKIYVPGGKLADGSISAQMEVYDPRRDSWAAAKALPAPRSGYGLATLDGRIYLFGGWDGKEVRAEAFVYDPATDSWSLLPSMPTARTYLSAAVVEGRIFVMGGERGGTALTSNEVYQPASQSWSAAAPLLRARSHFGTAVLPPNIYLFGGGSENTIVYYNVRSDNWLELSGPAEPIGTGAAVAQRDNSMFVLGSEVKVASTRIMELQALYQVTVP